MSDDDDKNLILIDWGFACDVGASVYFAGTVTFCAHKLLREMKNSTFLEAKYIAIYDCESMLKTFCYLLFKFKTIDEDQIFSERVGQSLDFWEKYDKNYVNKLYTMDDPYEILTLFATTYFKDVEEAGQVDDEEDEEDED